MKYSEILNKKQYQEYCKRHLALGNILAAGEGTADMDREYYVLDLIIEDYNRKQTNPFEDLTPVDLLKALMEEYGYSRYKLCKELGIAQSVMSDIVNYKRGFSKEVSRKLANKFNIGLASFLKQYELIGNREEAA